MGRSQGGGRSHRHSHSHRHHSHGHHHHHHHHHRRRGGGGDCSPVKCIVLLLLCTAVGGIVMIYFGVEEYVVDQLSSYALGMIIGGVLITVAAFAATAYMLYVVPRKGAASKTADAAERQPLASSDALSSASGVVVSFSSTPAASPYPLGSGPVAYAAYPYAPAAAAAP